MAFKSEKQRRFVMMMLNQNRIPSNLPKSLKTANNSELKKKGVRLMPNKDIDKDGVKNKNDCQPLNKMEQGKIHTIIKKLKKQEDSKRLTQKQKRTLKKSIKDLENVTTKEEIKIWRKKYSKQLGFFLPPAIAASILIPGFGLPAALFGIGAGLFAGLGISLTESELSKLESNKADSILNNRKQIRTLLIKRGFTKKQANTIIKSRVIRLERIANRKEAKAEQKRIKRLIK